MFGPMARGGIGGDSRSDAVRLAPARPLQRAYGRAELSFRARDGMTTIDRLYQQGQAKIRLPKVHGEPPVAVFLNTAGGITGGDRLDSGVVWGPDTEAAVTSQAAERAYRSDGSSADVTTRLELGAGAKGHWLPQEMIVFDGANLERRIEADVDASAELLMVETTLFGRAAMGETVRTCRFIDRWRIRRAGRLIYADTFRIGRDGTDDPSRILAGAATGSGASALSTILLVAPDAETRLADMRAHLEAVGIEAGASAWNGLLLARMVSTSPRDLRRDLVTVLERFRRRLLPRPWYC
ncbi:MAG: urease accessory protein UreD [Ancalomicrobiaceae bacterium]|nr:urease accessory protein UreD [Ancalomicrobiaceae bacterium]